MIVLVLYNDIVYNPLLSNNEPGLIKISVHPIVSPTSTVAGHFRLGPEKMARSKRAMQLLGLGGLWLGKVRKAFSPETCRVSKG